MGTSRIVHARRLAALLAVVVGLSGPCLAGAVETTFELRPAPAVQAAPPLPPTSVFPVQLVLDDDQIDAAFGVTAGNGAQQFLWFNRFDAPDTFSLEEIWVLFPAGPNVAVGGAVQLVVYSDPDGDPADGADLVTAFGATVQAADDVNFSIYPLPSPVVIEGGGDVLIGVVSRFVQSGVTPPTNPAALDTISPQGRSWFAVWSGDPPDPPLLPADVLTSPVDPFIAGNWMIRGFGGPPPPQVIPTLGAVGIGVLAALLALAALALLRRRARAAAAALVVLAGLAGATPASAQVLVDDFSTAQAALVVPPGTTASSSVSGAGILGGDRDAAIELTGGAGPVTLQVAAGDLIFDVTDASSGTALLTWDADSDPLSLDPVGLGGADLTAGGASAFRLVAGSANDFVDAVIEVFTDGANSSVAALRVPLGLPQDLFISFSEFVPAQGAGADFSNVGAITLDLRASGVTPSTGVVIELFDTVPPNLAAAKVDALTVDVDGDGLADPGDTLTYTITITNPGGEAVSVDLGDTVDPNTTLVGGSVSSTPIAKGDQYVAVGNVTLVADGTPPRVGLLANDSDPDGDPITVTAIDAFSFRGGPVSLSDATTGTFQYTPPPGFRGVDTFGYTAEDDDGNTDVGTATIHVEGIVWFVDNTNAGCGSPPCGVGTQADPFQTFKQAETASEADDVIRIREGDGTDTGHDQGFILKAGQRLVGGAADLVIGGTLIEAGTSHSVHSHAAGNVLDLAGDHTIEGMRLNPTAFASHGIAGTGSSNVTADNVIVYTAGSAGGVSLTNHSGSFVFSNGMITSTMGSIGKAVDIGGGSGLFDFSGSSVSNDGGGLIHVQNTTGGATVDFTGSNPTLTNGTDHGILLSNNSGGASITFDTIGDVGTSSGDGIRIAGSGTVNLSAVGNVSATGGAALDVSGTTIVKAGAPGAITFASLASASGAVGVNLNGVAPAVTVSGTTTVNGTTGINLQSSGAVTLTGQVGVTSTAGAAITASNTGLLTVAANTSTVDATGGPGLDITNTQLAIALATLSAAPGAGGRGVSLVGASGTLTSTGGAITGGTAGTAFHVDGGSVTATHGGTVTQNNAQRAVNVEDTTGGAVTFNAKVTGGASSTGVRIHNADGNASFADLDLGTSGSPMTATALTLSGGSAGTFGFADTQIFTTGATGLDANNGGTVEVTGAGNQVTSTTGTAISMIGGTTIGANGATFERVDSTGGANPGIRLDSTGSVAGSFFSVTGAGGDCQGNAANCSGGAISGKTGTGIDIDDAQDVRLAAMEIDGHSTHGIALDNVAGFLFDNARLTGNGDVAGEKGLRGRELSGAVTFNASHFQGNVEDHVEVVNETNATTSTVTFTDNLFDATSAGPPGNNAINYASRGTLAKNITFDLRGNTFQNVRATGVQIDAERNTLHNITIGGPNAADVNVFDNNNVALNLTNNFSGDVVALVENNTMTDHGSSGAGQVINLFTATSASSGSTFNATVRNNRIGTSGVSNSGTPNGNAVRVISQGDTAVRVLIEDNVVHGVTNGGIDGQARDGVASLDLTLRNNDLNFEDSIGVFVAGTGNAAGETISICADIGGPGAESNTVVNTELTPFFVFAGVTVQQAASGGGAVTFTLPNFAGGGTAAVETFIDGQNTISTPGAAFAQNVFATGTFTAGGTQCALP